MFSREAVFLYIRVYYKYTSILYVCFMWFFVLLFGITSWFFFASLFCIFPFAFCLHVVVSFSEFELLILNYSCTISIREVFLKINFMCALLLLLLLLFNFGLHKQIRVAFKFLVFPALPFDVQKTFCCFIVVVVVVPFGVSMKLGRQINF